MILTCPECGTNYVVKDGAIPVGGRKVRCASCKHSWHQEPEGVEGSDDPSGSDAAPAPTEAALSSSSIDDDAGGASGESARWDEPADPVMVDEFAAPSEPAPPEPVAQPYDGPIDPVAPQDERSWEMVDTGPPLREEEVAIQSESAPPATVEDEFEPFYPATEEEDSRSRRWPWVLLVILLLAAAAAAFWYLAPASMKQQVGLVQNRSPLEVMSINNSRQALASGNDLFTVSGRIINPTQASQPVPPLRAELLDETKSKVIHSWMISPPVDTLAPNESRAFHSAEMDVPEGGKFLRVRLSTEG